MSEQENTALVQQAYNCFKIGNIPALLELLSEDVTWQLPDMAGIPFAGKRTGRDGVGEFFASLAANQDAIRFEPREFVAQGNKVVSLGEYEWRVKATDRQVASEFAHVFTIRNGKIVDFQEYMDTAVCINAHQKAMTA